MKYVLASIFFEVPVFKSHLQSHELYVLPQICGVSNWTYVGPLDVLVAVEGTIPGH